MRRPLFALLCGLLVVPAALAAPRTTGDGVLELQAVNGTVTIGSALKPARGALWGQMDDGTLKVLDPDGSDRNIFVSGQDRKPTITDTDYGKLTTYVGHELHFRVTGGTYKLTFKGDGIDVTAVGVGVARLAGDPTALTTGSYAVDDAKWTPVPFFPLATQTLPVSFGDQSTAPTTTTTTTTTTSQP
jgi:hypothetical protein